MFTTDEFAAWFAALDDGSAEEVATALEIVEQLAPSRAAPESSEYLLWYEHRRACEFLGLESWAVFYGAARRMVLHLESSAFVARWRDLSSASAAGVAAAMDRIRMATAVQRRAFSVKSRGGSKTTPNPDQAGELTRWYLTALSLAGFDVTDLPAHSSSLREITLRKCRPQLRLLYGVDTQRGAALVVLGDRLDRTFYGDTVRRAEQLWKQFLEGDLRVHERAPLR